MVAIAGNCRRNVKMRESDLRPDPIGSTTDCESYGLNWPGKSSARRKAFASSGESFIPCRGESVSFDSTRNIFIEGDNLDALRLLRVSHAGTIKMIYIDPPYNTGQDLIYRDDFSVNSKSYRSQINSNGSVDAPEHSENDGRFHSDWLSMMYPRLLLARELLRNDGVIFISIDDNEAAQLRLLCDEVFGQACFVNQIVVKSSEASGVKMSHVEKRLPKIKEYILVYSRTPGGCRFEPVEVPKQSIDAYLKYYRSFIENPEKPPEKWRIVSALDAMRTRGLETDEDSVRSFKLANADRVVYRTNNAMLAAARFETKTAEVVSSRGTRYVWWEGKQMLFLSDYLTESLCDLWTDISTINLNKEMLGLPAFTKGQKPLALLERCLKMVCSRTDEAIAMDFFAGSGSFGHAAMRVMTEGYKVGFILVQQREPCSLEGFDTIADLARERLRRAGENISAGPQSDAVDTGFRVLKIK